MIRKLLRRILGPPIGDIYVVQLGGRIVGASTRQQGAEAIRVDEARRLSLQRPPGRTADEAYRVYYLAISIINTELQDGDA